MLFGSLTTPKPLTEAERVDIFLRTSRLLERRLKMPVGELRWVLKQEGDFTHKLRHFHFLLDGSNLANKDAAKLAVTFGKLWVNAGGGNHDVAAHVIDRDDAGYQKSVNYITKADTFQTPFSAYFNAGANCHLKFSESMDKHIAVLCSADQNNQPKGTA